MRSEGISHLKIPVTPPGIDPGTFRLVTQQFRSLCICTVKRIVTESIVAAGQCPSRPSERVPTFENGLIAVKFMFVNVRRVLQLTDRPVTASMN